MIDWPLNPDEENLLCEAAQTARENAYAPYSNFRVRAALKCEGGRIFTGCNVENASYGLCLCAERVAVGSAVAAGALKFEGIAIMTASRPPSPPCGMCRQVLSEFRKDLPVILMNDSGEKERLDLSTLFPSSFDHRLLQAGVDKSRS